MTPGGTKRRSSLFDPIGWYGGLRSDLARVLSCVATAKAERSAPVSALELMTILLEDRRFFKHHGVDWRSVLREVSLALAFRAHGGFSTIDMQFVRTATGFRQHTIRRKVYEVVLAVALQAHCDKRTILQSYLGCAYFGSGLTGATAAARRVFGKEPDQLDLREAAFVGAMLACPRPLSGSPRWEARVKRRAAYGLRIYACTREQLAGEDATVFESRASISQLDRAAVATEGV